MYNWIFVHDDTLEEIDREVVLNLEYIDTLGDNDVFVCVNGVSYDIVGSHKVYSARASRIDKILLCRKQTSVSRRKKQPITKSE